MIRIEELISYLKDKSEYKATTTKKFKADLYEIAVRSGAGDFIELGCDTGNTTAILASVVSRSAGRVFAFDIDERRLLNARNLLDSFGLGKHVNFIQSDIYSSDWTMWVLGRIALVFVDADHRYQNVRLDIANIRRLRLVRDCPVVFHDYGLIDGGVKQALSDSGIRVERYLGEPAGWWNLHRSHSTVDFEAALTRFNETNDEKHIPKG